MLLNLESQHLNMPKPKAPTTLDQAALLQAKRAVEGSAVNEKISEINHEIKLLEAENRVLEESIAAGGESVPKIVSYLSSRLSESTVQIRQLEARVLAAEEKRSAVITSLVALANSKEAHAQEISEIARQHDETIEQIRLLRAQEKELPELHRRRVELTAKLQEVRHKNKTELEVGLVFLVFGSHLRVLSPAGILTKAQDSNQCEPRRN